MLSKGARGLTFSAKWVPAIPNRNASHNRGRVEPSGKLTWMPYVITMRHRQLTRSSGEDGYSTFKQSYQHGDQRKINYNHVTKAAAIKH